MLDREKNTKVLFGIVRWICQFMAALSMLGGICFVGVTLFGFMTKTPGLSPMMLALCPIFIIQAAYLTTLGRMAGDVRMPGAFFHIRNVIRLRWAAILSSLNILISAVLLQTLPSAGAASTWLGTSPFFRMQALSGEVQALLLAALWLGGSYILEEAVRVREENSLTV